SELETEVAAKGWPFRVSMTWFYINCDLTFVSKASGISRLLEATGLSKDRVIGIGDTLSDKAIADNVKWFACPANAWDDLKTHADYISPHEEIDGVLDILAQAAN
ncbi:MAG: HAD hydrolase family protein, partial [bacterium]|nr:HAD hydrolase family protein [bacterium]